MYTVIIILLFEVLEKWLLQSSPQNVSDCRQRGSRFQNFQGEHTPGPPGWASYACDTPAPGSRFLDTPCTDVLAGSRMGRETSISRTPSFTRISARCSRQTLCMVVPAISSLFLVQCLRLPRAKGWGQADLSISNCQMYLIREAEFRGPRAPGITSKDSASELRHLVIHRWRSTQQPDAEHGC